MNKLAKLKARKALVIAEMRKNTDSEEFNQDAYDVSNAEVTQLNADIERETNLIAMEEDSKRVDDVPAVVVPNAAKVVINEEEFRLTEAFATYLRDPAVKVDNKTRAVLNTLVAAEGGYLVPEVFMTNIIDKLLDISVMRQARAGGFNPHILEAASPWFF